MPSPFQNSHALLADYGIPMEDDWRGRLSRAESDVLWSDPNLYEMLPMIGMQSGRRVYEDPKYMLSGELEGRE